MLLCKKIKLEVSDQDAQALQFMQSKCRGLYNWWIMRLRDGERWPGWKAAKATLQESKQHDPELEWVYGKLLHEVYFRADKAMKAFFRRVKAGETPGFPRFWKRIYHCERCGLVMDRDENSAHNILKRFLARLGP